MNRKTLAALGIICIVILIGYLMVNRVFPSAKSLGIQFVENINSIEFINNEASNERKSLEVVDFASFITIANNAKPTRKMSVNDNPTVTLYYRIEVMSDQVVTIYYVYEAYGKVYLEIPYQGIYTVDAAIFNLLNK